MRPHRLRTSRQVLLHLAESAHCCDAQCLSQQVPITTCPRSLICWSVAASHNIHKRRDVLNMSLLQNNTCACADACRGNMSSSRAQEVRCSQACRSEHLRSDLNSKLAFARPSEAPKRGPKVETIPKLLNLGQAKTQHAHY